MSLIEHRAKIDDARDRLKAAKKDWETKRAEHEAEIAELLRQYRLLVSGADLDRVAVAESIIRVEGIQNYPSGDDCGAVNDAIHWFVHQTPREGSRCLRSEYYGTKNFDRWYHQRSDHPYGYGPKHGSIVFRIGLRDRAAELTDAEREACIYYLELLKAGKLVEKAA